MSPLTSVINAIRNAGVKPCPYRGGTRVSVVNPRPPRLFVECLAACAELTAARLALRKIITLADQAPGMTDTELRAQSLTRRRAIQALVNPSGQ